jgi:hypothetical protein
MSEMDGPLWLNRGVCDACGTKKGIRKNGSTPQLQVCGPTTDCGENKTLRNTLNQIVHHSYAKDVCEALGVTLSFFD